MIKYFAAACFALALFVTPSDASSQASEWLFEQKHNSLGKQRIYLLSDAVKIVNDTAGFEILAKAPSWNVYYYRRDDKVLCMMPLETFLSGKIYGNFTRAISQAPALHKISSKTDGDLNYSIYQSFDRAKIYWYTDNIAVDSRVLRLIESYNRFNASDKQSGILMHISAFVKVGKNSDLKDWSFSAGSPRGNVDYLSTVSWKKLPLRSSDFAAPVGFKKVTDVTLVATSAERRASAGSIFGELDLGEGFGKKSH